MFFGVQVSEPHFQVLPTMIHCWCRYWSFRTLSPSFKSRNFWVRLLCLKSRSRNRVMQAFIVFSHRPGHGRSRRIIEGKYQALVAVGTHSMWWITINDINHSQYYMHKPCSEEWNIRSRRSQFRTVNLRSNYYFESNHTVQVQYSSWYRVLWPERSTHRFVVTNSFFKFEGRREILIVISGLNGLCAVIWFWGPVGGSVCLTQFHL